MVQQSQILADRLHDALLRELAEIAPAGGPSVPTDAIASALVTLLAEIVTASSQDPEAEVSRWVALFRDRLHEAVADRGVVGHA